MLVKVFVTGDNERVKNKLISNGYEEFAKYIEGNFWFVDCPDPLGLYKALEQLDLVSSLDVRLFEVEANEFFKPIFKAATNSYIELDVKYHKLLKYIYIQERVNTETIQNVIAGARPYHFINNYEEKIGKSVLEFDKDDIDELIKGERLLWVSFINLLAAYQLYDYYYEITNQATPWDYVRGIKRLSARMSDLSGDILMVTITREALVNRVLNSSNKQVALLPLLVFEGVRFTRHSDEDELLGIKIQDLTETGIYLHGKKERFLQMDKEVMEAVFATANYDKMDEDQLADTGYLFRPVLKHANKSAGGSMAYISIRQRMDRFFIEASKELVLDRKLRLSDVENLGKIFHVKRNLLSGYKYKDSFVKAMERFGFDFTKGNTFNEEQINDSIKNKLFRFTSLWRQYGTQSDLDKFNLKYLKEGNTRRTSLAEYARIKKHIS